MIRTDDSRNDLLTKQGRAMLDKFYCRDGESPQKTYARMCNAFNGGDDELGKRMYGYISKQWMMSSSPPLSNAPDKGEDPKGMPISCFLTYVNDTLESLIEHMEETAWLSVMGGGVGGHWEKVRSVSDKAPGPIPFMRVTDAQMVAYKQGSTRKGSYAAYLNAYHPDIIEFINFKMPSGGDIDRKCFNLFNAVNTPDALMQAGLDDGMWDLKDPHTNEVCDTIKARTLIETILEVRYRTGVPYINFIDAANRGLPKAQKDMGLQIYGSNLCNEIHLATSDERTAVCCLSSVNLEYYDAWKGTNMVGDIIRFLDNVLQFFIDHAPVELAKAVYSATRERSLGLGAMGFHYYLQKNNIPWESLSAQLVNKEMFAHIQARALLETGILAKERGEAPDMRGYGVRNAHLLAIAPNANSSILCNTSPSIEPLKSNAFVHRTRVGSHLVKNKYLEKVLEEEYARNDDQATWDSIINNKGSVKQFHWMSAEHKELFKTAFEIDPHWVVQHAVDRQPYICQGQSVNLFFPEGADRAQVLAVHYRAWKGGLKGLYYLRTEAFENEDKVGLQVERHALADYEECLSCEG